MIGEARFVLAALAALAGGPHVPAPPVHDGFDDTTLSRLWRADKINGSAFAFQAEHVRAGQRALRITIHPNDPTPKISADKTERDELQERDDLNAREGEGYAYAFSLFIPTNFPVVPTRLVLAQWKQNTEGHKVVKDNPVIAVRYVGGELFITTQSDQNKVTRFSTHADIRGRWTDFVFHLRHARDETGLLRVWMNGEKIVDFHGSTAYRDSIGYPPQGRFYFKMGLYRDDMAEPMTIYLDEYGKRPLTEAELR